MKLYDVAIAGAGLIGASAALELALAGLRVAVFDRQEPGREASWAGAGILSPAPEDSAGIAMVPLGKASLAAYPDFVARVEELSGQPVGFRPKGAIDAIFSGDAAAELSTIIALHHGVGLAAEPLRADEARELEPALSEEIEAAVLRPDEASVDNRALTGAVVEAARRSGAEFFSGREVTGFWKEGARCGGLRLQGERVSAEWTIFAVGCFAILIEGIAPYAPMRPAKGQILSLRPKNARIERVIWSEKGYLVPRDDGRVLAGATVEHAGFDKSLTAGGLQKILSTAIELAPVLVDSVVDEMWAGLRPESVDHLPILGPTDVPGLLMATGHFRSGILLAPITARLLLEWITLQRVSVDWERCSPLRFERAAAQKAKS